MSNLLPKKIYAKCKKAQHIVEIVLLAPFVILLIGIIAEFAIIINVNYKFNSAIYEAISISALKNKINTKKEDTVKNIEGITKILLGQKFVPYKNSIKIKLIETDNIDFLIGTYQYTSTFTILNPNETSYNFLTIIPVNSAILKENSFDIEDAFFDTDFQKTNLENTQNDTLQDDVPQNEEASLYD